MTVDLISPLVNSAQAVAETYSLRWKVKGKTIVDDISLSVTPGESVGIIGPNDSGKTSPISLLTGLLKPTSGHITLQQRALQHYSRRHFVQQVALVKQQAETSGHLTALQTVSLGRTPWLNILSPRSAKNDDIMQTMLEKVDLSELQYRCWHTFSGGEKQRLRIARALAQQPQLLLMGEPTNHLDIQHQISLLSLVKREGPTVIAALHDLNHAAVFCNRTIIMTSGHMAIQRKPCAVFIRESLHSWFGIDTIIKRDAGGKSYFTRYQRPGEF